MKRYTQDSNNEMKAYFYGEWVKYEDIEHLFCRGCNGEGSLHAAMDGELNKLITCKICNGTGKP